MELNPNTTKWFGTLLHVLLSFSLFIPPAFLISQQVIDSKWVKAHTWPLYLAYTLLWNSGEEPVQVRVPERSQNYGLDVSKLKRYTFVNQVLITVPVAFWHPVHQLTNAKPGHNVLKLSHIWMGSLICLYLAFRVILKMAGERVDAAHSTSTALSVWPRRWRFQLFVQRSTVLPK